MSTVSLKQLYGKTHAYWSGVFAMTLCVFVLIASEFMPVSLLTLIAHDLHVTEGLAGQGIAVSGALAVLTSLTISRITGDLNRKYLLLGLTALMAISGIVITIAIRRQLVLPTRANYTGRTLQCDIKSRLLLPSLSFSCSFHLSVRTYIRDGSAGLPPPPP